MYAYTYFKYTQWPSCRAFFLKAIKGNVVYCSVKTYCVQVNRCCIYLPLLSSIGYFYLALWELWVTIVWQLKMPYWHFCLEEVKISIHCISQLIGTEESWLMCLQNIARGSHFCWLGSFKTAQRSALLKKFPYLKRKKPLTTIKIDCFPVVRARSYMAIINH